MNELEQIVKPQGEQETEELMIRLDQFGKEALIGKKALADLFHCCEKTIDAGVQRGDLPEPIMLAGKNVWMVGRIVSHLERRFREAAGEAY